MTFDPIKIQFRVMRSDYIALCQAITRRTPRRLAVSFAIFGVAILGGALIGVGGDLSSYWGVLVFIAQLQAPPWLYVVLAAAIVMLVFGQPYTMALQAALIYRRNVIADKDVQVTIDAAGIETVTPEIRSHVAWGGIKRVIDAKDHLFLTVSRREALMLPKRAFTDAADFERLRQYAITCVAKSAGSP